MRHIRGSKGQGGTRIPEVAVVAGRAPSAAAPQIP